MFTVVHHSLTDRLHHRNSRATASDQMSPNLHYSASTDRFNDQNGTISD